ncbi:three-Cys-motif partner protein TcmP [Halomonas qaidamensis]|uniref:Three-Cys-motif partner protein TcmP n=1 Tax=Halomonas qaidamensis TaxID=2866211 RepID=A0ABY6JR22_9GAMM|nr:three-Cys-motif partner protein TcmP [Halomonas qaidamensis]UYV18977.1 three-Cys-motif partner protein TcmP [Halomonas qaidamensis]
MPSKNGYDWSDFNLPPIIDQHSIAKHEVICDYLKRYIRVFTKNPTIEKFRINLIDGFAGGGRYRLPDTSDIVPGSPLLLLRTMKEAEAEVNASGRRKYFQIDANYYFVEIDEAAFRHLEFSLNEHGYSSRDKIKSLKTGFLDALPDIIADIKRRQRSPRNIFILDQYGYKDVPANTIRSIFKEFPKSTEVILTFSTDSLINYMSNDPRYVSLLAKINLEGLLEKPELQSRKDVSRSRLLIEQLLYEEIKEQCGASFLTPFFIVSPKSNRSYWLIHLSSHPTARNEMLLTHWGSQNTFEHHGGDGLNMMLGYNPTLEALANQETFDFYFDDDANKRVIAALLEEIPKYIGRREGLNVQDLIFDTCNNSPATLSQYKEALFTLQSSKILKILTSSNQQRRVADTINFEDQIVISKQLIFLLP